MADGLSRADDRHVAIVGAGFAGTLQAINLLRHDGPRATLIERRPQAGRGIAYSAAHPDHLLNVRAGNMSALPDDPDHFRRWLALRHPALDGFVPRIVYGDYLAELLEEATVRSQGRLQLVAGEAIDIRHDTGGRVIRLMDGREIRADYVVLAPGNLPPHEPPALSGAVLGPDLYAPDPWAADLAEGLDDEDCLLIVGTGLTMVDIVLLLEARGYRGKIVALSRRGLLPHAHAGQTIAAPLGERPPLTTSALLRSVRARARSVGWRAAVDALRPFTQDLWLGANPDARQRFLRHLRPWWDIHRHRLAPEVAARIVGQRASGRLDVRAGKLVGAQADSGAAVIDWRSRGAERTETLRVRRIVNASGPQGDLLRTREPLLRNLLACGMIRPDPLHIGLEVNPQCEVIDATGQPDPDLLAIGPMTRGTFWEIVAVPDIRVQTWSVARKLSHAHWVEGEGL